MNFSAVPVVGLIQASITESTGERMSPNECRSYILAIPRRTGVTPVRMQTSGSTTYSMAAALCSREEGGVEEEIAYLCAQEDFQSGQKRSTTPSFHL